MVVDSPLGGSRPKKTLPLQRLMATGGEDRTELIVIPENEEPDQLVTVELHLNEETSIIPIESNETVSTSSACNYRVKVVLLKLPFLQVFPATIPLPVLILVER